jgi:organic radical activating enzyme
MPDEDSEYKPKTLKEHWNSPYMMDIRKKLMAGEKISQCEVCNDNILAHDPYRNYFTKTLFPNKVNEAFEKTRDDGYTEMEPISFDYRITNLCNFKCRMCGNPLSSSWENEDKKRFPDEKQIKERMVWATDENKKIINKFQKEVVEQELLNAVNDKTIEEIYWVGGEPLIWPIHWEVMNTLIENGHSKNVTIRYNSNLSKINYKNYNLYDMLLNFKDVKLSASIDATEEIVEYIRDGIKWEKWLENFKAGLVLKEKFGEWAIYLDFTVTSPGLFSAKKMIDLALELDVNTIIKTIFSFDAEILLSPLMLPREILDPILDDIILYAKEKTKINHKIKMYVNAFEDIKTKKTFQEQYPDWRKRMKMGKISLSEIDKYRGDDNVLEKIFSRNPDVLAWWKQIDEF